MGYLRWHSLVSTPESMVLICYEVLFLFFVFFEGVQQARGSYLDNHLIVLGKMPDIPYFLLERSCKDLLLSFVLCDSI